MACHVASQLPMATKRVRTSTLTRSSQDSVSKKKPYYKRLPFYGKSLRFTGFPDQLAITHRYVAAPAFASVSGVMVSQVFSCNGLFDPYITGAGTQPLYFDQCAALYDHYTVTASRIYVTLTGAGNTATWQFYATVSLDDDNSSPYTAIVDLISDDATTWGIGGGVANNPLKLSASWKGSNIYGVKDLAGDTSLSGTATQNPTEQTFYRIAIQESAFTNSVTANSMIVIEYDTIWRERKEVAVS